MKEKISKLFLGLLTALFLCPLVFSWPVSADGTGCLAVDVRLRDYTTGEQIKDTSVYAKLKGNVYENGKLVRTVSNGNDGFLCLESEPKNTYMHFLIGQDNSGGEYPEPYGITNLTLGNVYQFELIVPDGYKAELYKVDGYGLSSGTWKISNNRLVFTYTQVLQKLVWEEGMGYTFDTYYYYHNASEPLPTPSPTPAAVSQTSTLIYIPKDTFTCTSGGSSFKLNASVKRGNGTISYKSSDSSVASVNARGIVKPGKTGKTTITLNVSGSSAYKATQKKITIKVLPKTTASVTASVNSKKKTAKITWKKDTTVSGYQVVVARDKAFKKSAKTYTISSAKTASKTIKSLKKGQYYVKVRAYKKVSGETLYGKYSTVKGFNVK